MPKGRESIPGTFIETVNSALFQSPFYAAYSKVMLQSAGEAGSYDRIG